MFFSANQNHNWNTVHYVIEFMVIVFGITASFWVEEYRENLQILEDEQKVLQNLQAELTEINTYCDSRIQAYEADQEIIQSLLDDTTDTPLTLPSTVTSIFQIQVAVYDYRGFKPPMVRYNSIVNEGSFKYVSSDKIKTMFNELNTAYLNIIEGNVQQEKDIQHEIVMHLTRKYPDLITDYDGKKTADPAYIESLETILAKDEEFKALLKIKTRFITVKRYFVHEYSNLAKELKTLISAEIKSPAQ